MKKTCLVCKKEFHTPPCRLRAKIKQGQDSSRWFCSQKCYHSVPISDETREKLSLVGKGRPHSEIHKIRIGLAHRGTKKPYAAKNLKHGFGKDNPFYGRRHSEATRERLRFTTSHQKPFQKDTKPELALYKILTDLNIPFKKQVTLEGITRADAVMDGRKIVFYADGDYWHNLPEYVERDKRINQRLTELGWEVYRFWEHDLLKAPRRVLWTLVTNGVRP